MKREFSEQGVRSKKLRKPTVKGKTSAQRSSPHDPSIKRARAAGKENGHPKPQGRKSIQKIMFILLRVAAAINGLALLVIVFFLVKNGWRAINLTFLIKRQPIL